MQHNSIPFWGQWSIRFPSVSWVSVTEFTVSTVTVSDSSSTVLILKPEKAIYRLLFFSQTATLTIVLLPLSQTTSTNPHREWWVSVCSFTWTIPWFKTFTCLYFSCALLYRTGQHQVVSKILFQLKIVPKLSIQEHLQPTVILFGFSKHKPRLLLFRICYFFFH